MFARQQRCQYLTEPLKRCSEGDVLLSGLQTRLVHSQTTARPAQRRRAKERRDSGSDRSSASSLFPFSQTAFSPIATSESGTNPSVLRCYEFFTDIRGLCGRCVAMCREKQTWAEEDTGYKEHCTQDSDTSVPFKAGPLGPHTVLQLPSAALLYFSESHQWSETSSLSKVILVLGKARSLRAPNLGCTGPESPG